MYEAARNVSLFHSTSLPLYDYDCTALYMQVCPRIDFWWSKHVWIHEFNIKPAQVLQLHKLLLLHLLIVHCSTGTDGLEAQHNSGLQCLCNFLTELWRRIL